ncbi:MAG: hypothetical protein WBZ54_16960, partial [Methylocella sp.]
VIVSRTASRLNSSVKRLCLFPLIATSSILPRGWLSTFAGQVQLMLEPGARICRAAVDLAARAGTLVVWVGEAGVRLYAAGQPGGARSDRLLCQARLALDDGAG